MHLARFRGQPAAVIHAWSASLGAFVGGALTGWLVGLLKATTGAHEVIVTIMLNYVLADFLSWILGTSAMQRPGRTNLISPLIATNAHLPLLLGSHLRVNAGFLLALAAAAGVWWLLSRSTIGFEFERRGQPQRRPQRRDERAPDLDPGHADLRRAGLAWPPAPSSRAPTSP